ncbi:hypothetical protein SAMN04489841_3124 [Natrinema salaciae]|uniref:Uncharacterized protein n=1 Tax=Natrinema salaciae TaxID=1186196 RepID=A0A1H9LXG8_9EURY|nr:hypothetical protein SAMN04489841_3124 [Natrinema salaciae]
MVGPLYRHVAHESPDSGLRTIAIHMNHQSTIETQAGTSPYSAPLCLKCETELVAGIGRLHCPSCGWGECSGAD